MKNADSTDDSGLGMLPPALHLREQVSAFMDGELPREQAVALLRRVSPEDRGEADAAWAEFHLIGEVLRHGHAAAQAPRSSAVASVMARIAHESIVPAAVPEAATSRRDRAANDPVFRWKLAAGFASLAAVAAVAWNIVGVAPVAPGPVLAGTQAPAPVVVVSAPAAQPAAAPSGSEVIVPGEMGPVIRDARLEELMAAHRQLGGMSALQMPAGFLRNATFETPQR